MGSRPPIFSVLLTINMGVGKGGGQGGDRPLVSEEWGGGHPLLPPPPTLDI